MQQISYNSVEDITDDIRKQIGWRIQEKRIEKGITAVDLSTYLNITANQVSRIERGCAGIDIYKLIVICKILGVSADYILFGEMLLSAIVETIGISAIIPFINALLAPQKLLNNNRLIVKLYKL